MTRVAVWECSFRQSGQSLWGHRLSRTGVARQVASLCSARGKDELFKKKKKNIIYLAAVGLGCGVTHLRWVM